MQLSMDGINIDGIHIPQDQAQIVLAMSVLAERIKRLSEEDKRDLFELVKALGSCQTTEDSNAVLRAFMEILEDKPGSYVIDHGHEQAPSSTPEHYRKWTAWISSKLRDERQKKGFTQTQLAQRSGLPQSHISRLENGEHSPSHMTLEKIAKALGIDVGVFDLS